MAVLYLVAVACRYLIWIDGQHFHNYSIRQSMGKGTLSSLAFLLDTVQSFAPLVMLVLVGTGLVMRRRRRIMVGMFLFGIEVTWGLTSGSRAKMLIPLFLLVVVLGRVWRPIRLRHVIVGAVLLVFLLFPLVTAFRTAFEQQRYGASRTGITTSMIAEALTDSFTTEASIYVSAERLTPMQLFSHRLHGLSSLASIMRYTPEPHG